MTMIVTHFNRVFSWPFVIGVSGLLAPLVEGPSTWVYTMFFALPAASFILLSVALACRTGPARIGCAATVLRCLWASVVAFGILGPAAMLAHEMLSERSMLALVLITIPLGVAVCDAVHRGLCAFDDGDRPPAGTCTDVPAAVGACGGPDDGRGAATAGPVSGSAGLSMLTPISA